MNRWEPDARGRLERAAMELYGEHGFDSTTVAEIAERAGLTERTFFRHFADKREVLFAGAAALKEHLVRYVDEAPASLPPIEVIAAAFADVAALSFDNRLESVRVRQAIVGSHAELQERELIKLDSLASALADALRRRGVKDPAARLAAEAGTAVFKIAFDTWVDDANAGDRTLSDTIRESAAELKVLASGG